MAETKSGGGGGMMILGILVTAVLAIVIYFVVLQPRTKKTTVDINVNVPGATSTGKQ
jgi:hypothetical protein